MRMVLDFKWNGLAWYRAKWLGCIYFRYLCRGIAKTIGLEWMRFRLSDEFSWCLDFIAVVSTLMRATIDLLKTVSWELMRIISRKFSVYVSKWWANKKEIESKWWANSEKSKANGEQVEKSKLWANCEEMVDSKLIQFQNSREICSKNQTVTTQLNMNLTLGIPRARPVRPN